MTRSLLRPIRTRRVTRLMPGQSTDADLKAAAITPGTRQTLAAIGALWVSFATSASATLPRASSAAPLDSPTSADNPPSPTEPHFSRDAAIRSDREALGL